MVDNLEFLLSPNFLKNSKVKMSLGREVILDVLEEGPALQERYWLPPDFLVEDPPDPLPLEEYPDLLSLQLLLLLQSLPLFP